MTLLGNGEFGKFVLLTAFVAAKTDPKSAIGMENLRKNICGQEATSCRQRAGERTGN